LKDNFSKLFFLSLDIILKVRQPVKEEVAQFQNNSTLISFIYPAQNKELLEQLAAKNMTVFGKITTNNIDDRKSMNFNFQVWTAFLG
jgi:NAD(P) transhydrogenase subunit alpha